jgi:hypothetical protein
MNPVIKTKWVEALRSGGYEQGTGALRRNDKFCCLGVLCDLAAKEEVVEVGIDEHSYKVTFDGSRNYLPDSVQNWAELDHNPRVPSPENTDVPTYLAYLNDEGRPFSEIADIIEENL